MDTMVYDGYDEYSMTTTNEGNGWNEADGSIDWSPVGFSFSCTTSLMTTLCMVCYSGDGLSCNHFSFFQPAIEERTAPFFCSFWDVPLGVSAEEEMVRLVTRMESILLYCTLLSSVALYSRLRYQSCSIFYCSDRRALEVWHC